LDIGSEGFAVRGVDRETRYRWDAIWRAVDTSRFLFLYVAKIQIHPIPKKQLTVDEVDQLIALCHKAIGDERWSVFDDSEG